MVKNIENKDLILFWQFTVRTIEELDIVSNQNLAIEMFLLRLIYISSIKHDDHSERNKNSSKSIEKKAVSELRTEAVNQIKNVTQEEKISKEVQTEVKAENKISINSFEKLLEICGHNKEIKLKYELEKNVNLVSFEKNKLVSFDNLEKIL